MTVTEALRRRISARAFLPDPVAGALVREILETAALAPSGGNMQPWRVSALTGEPLAKLKAEAAEAMARGDEASEHHLYPPKLWDPYRTRRYACGEDLYAAIGVAREDRAARLAQLAKNYDFFGAPVGLLFTIDRGLSQAQWADAGMYVHSVMLLAAERGLDTCAQGCWANLPRTVGRAVDMPAEHMVMCGMALGYGDPDAPINTWRTRREPLEAFAQLRGF